MAESKTVGPTAHDHLRLELSQQSRIHKCFGQTTRIRNPSSQLLSASQLFGIENRTLPQPFQESLGAHQIRRYSIDHKPPIPTVLIPFNSLYDTAKFRVPNHAERISNAATHFRVANALFHLSSGIPSSWGTR
jgi:hypothetical protein